MSAQPANRYGFGDNAPGNNSIGNTGDVALRDLRKRQPLRVLSDADFAHWQHNGYVIVRNAIDADAIERTAALLWEFQQMDPNDSSTWYQDQRRDHAMVELNNSGMVECYNHPLLWANRQTPRVYQAFVDIWDREDLWVTIDRANLNPPNIQRRAFSGFIHWDANTSLDPLPINVQGVLALSDTDEQTGGFQCVPELFRDFDAWRATQPADRDPYRPDLGELTPTFIPMRAGDLLIFNSLLAHGIRPNQSDRARLAQYIAMVPADEANTEMRDWRIQSWRDREPPQGYAFPGDPREWEKVKYGRAELTELGERLLGLSSWR